MWIDVVLTEPPTITPRAGEAPITRPLERHLKKLLRFQRHDPRPALLYFHYAHEEEAEPTREGKASLRQCTVMEDEQVSRWSMIYRCLVVDVAASDPKVLARVGCDGKAPSFAVVDAELDVVAKRASCFAPKELRAFLEKTVTEGVPEYWKVVQGQIAEQEALRKEAQRLEEEGKLLEALEQLTKVRRSPIRVGAAWDESVDAARRLERTIAQLEKK